MSGVTKKYDRSYFGYKNHIDVDRRHKFVRRFGLHKCCFWRTDDAADPDYDVFNAIIPPINLKSLRATGVRSTSRSYHILQRA